MQPCSSISPVALDGSERYTHRCRNLRQAQTAEEAELHDLSGEWILLLQERQCFIQSYNLVWFLWRSNARKFDEPIVGDWLLYLTRRSY